MGLQFLAYTNTHTHTLKQHLCQNTGADHDYHYDVYDDIYKARACLQNARFVFLVCGLSVFFLYFGSKAIYGFVKEKGKFNDSRLEI